MINAQKCPVCRGTGWVSVPPGVAGDAEWFSSTSCGPWPCRCCSGGILYIEQPDKADNYNYNYEFDYTPHKGTWE
jgi:hypothetical protein